ncbi:MAG: hypothetical protein MZV70_42610 [Desulfobacterales bacterium]|nr:hypothetical protein [Desulfobacterales bacterium]
MPFPIHRPRRLRRTETIRRMVRETSLEPSDFIAPLFVCDGDGVRREIAAMPGCYQLSVDTLLAECRELAAAGVPGVILFGIPSAKDAEGSGACDHEGPVARAAARVAERVPRPVVMGRRVPLRVHRPRPLRPVVAEPDGRWRWTTTARSTLLARMAVAHAEAGRRRRRAVGHDGRPRRRDPRGARRGRPHRRGRSCRTPRSTRRPSTARSARRPSRRRRSATGAATRWTRPTSARRCARCALDVDEGADIVMVKPALPYLDVVRRGEAGAPTCPVAAYNVSRRVRDGEGRRAARLDRRAARHDARSCPRSARAGADIILTYFAKDAARLLG